MKIRYEMRTSLGRERQSFSVSTTAVAKAGKIYRGALAVAILVFALLVATAAGILTQVVQIVSVLSANVVRP